MKQFIAILAFVGCALAGPGGPPPPECFKMSKVFPDCCKVTLFPTDVVEKCKAAHPQPAGPPPDGPPKGGCCFSECIMNSTGIVHDGKLDKDAALKMVGSLNNNDAAVTKAVSDAIDTCTAKLAEKEKEHPMPPPAPGQCAMCSGFMKGCVSKEVNGACPASLKQSNGECDAIKALGDKCGFLMA